MVTRYWTVKVIKPSSGVCFTGLYVLVGSAIVGHDEHQDALHTAQVVAFVEELTVSYSVDPPV